MRDHLIRIFLDSGKQLLKFKTKFQFKEQLQKLGTKIFNFVAINIYLFIYLFIYLCQCYNGKNSPFFQQDQAIIKILSRFSFSSCIRVQGSGDEA